MKKTSWDYLYVGIQFILFVMYIIPLTRLTFSAIITVKIVGIVLLIIGLLIGFISVIQLHKNLSPFPTPISGSKLIETGAFKYIRHPIYTSILFVLFGYALYVGSVNKISVTLVLLILFFFKSRYEEKKLTSVFVDYPNYRKRTGRFLPKFF